MSYIIFPENQVNTWPNVARVYLLGKTSLNYVYLNAKLPGGTYVNLTAKA